MQTYLTSVRLSEYFMPTFKEVPTDAHLTSHKLMLKASMIYQVAAGLYGWGPLGLRVLQRLSDLVREEQNAAGGVEVLMPTIQPAFLWEESGRYDSYGKELLRFQDRHNKEMLYGPTGEEILTMYFGHHVKSYKELPQRLYQIQWKFRDEIRPRFGVMRGREFIMKDMYSFDVDKAAAIKSYEAVLASYYRIFKRLEVRAMAVRADTGPIGGDLSHEFVMVADNGESTVTCQKGLLDKGAMTLDELNQVYAMADDQHVPATCPLPADQLESFRAIEVGHIFYFGTKYSAPLNTYVMMPDGSKKPIEMGSYGIGLSRLAAGLIEASHDERGIIWPEEAAPFDMALVCLKPADDASRNVCEQFFEKLQDKKSVLYDERNTSAGAKFADMDLVGIPYQIIVGPKGAAANTVEIKQRKTGKTISLTPEALLGHIADKPLRELYI